MHRVSIINDLYDHAKRERQNGDQNKSITPFYFGINSEGIVFTSNVLVRLLAKNPIYIIGWTVHNYQYYGNRQDGQIFCFINQQGQIISSIPFKKWSLSNIVTFQTDIIEGASITNLENNQEFYFYEKSSNPLSTMQQLWDFIKEVDVNCSTVKEVEIYYKYFIKKLELAQIGFSLNDYVEQLAEKTNLINQYADLLKLIDSKLSTH